MIIARVRLPGLAARLAAAGGLGLALAPGTGGVSSAAAWQLPEPPPGPVHRWLECRAAAARVMKVASVPPEAALSARLTPAEREAMRARMIDRRVARRLETMDLSDRGSEELEALLDRFAGYYNSPEGAGRAREVLAACEDELTRQERAG